MDHPPSFVLHLKEVDLEGGNIWVDLEVRMVDGYPESRGPELKLVRKKGITAAQLETIQKSVEARIGGLIGSEMIYDLVEEAKVYFGISL